MEIVNGQSYIHAVRDMILVYTNALSRDLSFQNLSAELADLEGKYCFPAGALLVAIEKSSILGMVAYHRLSDSRC